ncbi:MAG: MBL fold metallo-hydrolase [Thermodesulfobacteriota bacterium]|nr:MBL fold metallo-hydrolase [Thermodesulfobacteriota bacterium]
MKKSVKISILCEDQAKMGYMDKIFLAQHGFSAFIQAGENILFDTGATDVFISNAALLGIDLNATDLIVLSHGHWDHTNGLKSLHMEGMKKKLLAHPDIFTDRHKATGEYNGMPYNQKKTAEKFNLVLSRKPLEVSENIFFLGEIPRVNGFEARKTTFFYMDKGEKVKDFIMDDTALAIRTEKGLVIVTGCSHAGICNIVEYAKKVTDQEKIYTVMGGFHLLGDQVQLQKTIDYFQKNKVNHLYPMHCTDLKSLSKFHETFGIKKLCAGDIIEINP